MSDEESTVKIPLLPSGAAAITDFPDSHLRTSSKPSDDGTRDSTASLSAARIASASSRTSSAEATDTLYTSSSSSSPPPSSDPSTTISISTTPSPEVPPWTTRIPARLRRKCPIYVAEQDQRGDDDGSAKNVDVDGESEEDELATSTSPSPPAPPLPKTPVTRRRPRVPPPVPVPHLIKKSRGRRVPAPTEARERAHVCAVPGCSKSFARAEHLKRHVLSLHTHEKRTFLSSFTYRRGHTDGRSAFACECGKTFARRDNLLQHQRVHATTVT